VLPGDGDASFYPTQRNGEGRRLVAPFVTLKQHRSLWNGRTATWAEHNQEVWGNQHTAGKPVPHVLSLRFLNYVVLLCMFRCFGGHVKQCSAMPALQVPRTNPVLNPRWAGIGLDPPPGAPINPPMQLSCCPPRGQQGRPLATVTAGGAGQLIDRAVGICLFAQGSLTRLLLFSPFFEQSLQS